MTESLVKIKDLEVVYTTKKNIFGGVKTIHAVNGVSLDIKKGEILAIAGESGCGKSTLAKAVMRLVNVKSGEIKLEDENILNFKNREDLKHFYQRVQMIFQNPYSSLNPKMKIGQILREPLEINTKLNRTEIDKIVEDKLAKVGLDKSTLELYPHEFSGGQRQRIAIARALILNPKLLIADEPVSALDASIQAQIINLLKELKQERNLTILFISHDLSVIKYLADRVGIMYFGELIEENVTSAIFNSPQKDYTKMLLNSAPILKN